MTNRRLIEVAFPLEQASLDSVHEKNVRHGHISTLHIWPARRPLAACRAALIAALLPDPSTPEKRRELCERIGGRVEKVIEKKKGPGAAGEEKVVRKTVGGILHWGRETENKAALEFSRQEIRKAFGGRAPRVLDPFAGGGAIPLEAMRLGCEVTAIDINPVAWFILKCTLEYPQKLAGQKRPLPTFVRSDHAFMESFFKSQGLKGAMLRSQLRKLGLSGSKQTTTKQSALTDTQTGKDLDLTIEEHTLEADLAWHVRAWGWWVLRQARRKLARHYPVYADFQSLKDINDWRERHTDEGRPLRLVPIREDGSADVDSLNREFSSDYLADERNPRWIAKPTVAYLWARTVRCKNCRAIIPLLKTCWLSKSEAKRVALRMQANSSRTRVEFTIEANIPIAGGNNAQRREHDRRIGQGTMSRAGAWCPCCGKPGTVAMETHDIRAEGLAGRLGRQMTAVAIEGSEGTEFRAPSEHELAVSEPSPMDLREVFDRLPFGIPNEPLPGKDALGIRVPLYGLDTWDKLYTGRQLLALGSLALSSREAVRQMNAEESDASWTGAVANYLALGLGRTANYLSTLCLWDSAAGEVKQTFLRFALPITWDFAEANPLSGADRYYAGGISKIGRVLDSLLPALKEALPASVTRGSAITFQAKAQDLVITDPPYYDAIPYSDLMDFFYVWMRRQSVGLGSQRDDIALSSDLAPKWDHESQDGELIDDSSRFANDGARSMENYRTGMSRAFHRCADALSDDGRLIVVFANKRPAAWETLVDAVIDSGFVVTGSLPIQTEMRGGVRNLARASLSSSIWLVCRKRPVSARLGWDNVVLEHMRREIAQSLREFWDAGIRGPDFVWAATGPALEAYSRHPVVKKANDPGETMSVSEFLRAVRRMVVQFVVGRVLGELTHGQAVEGPEGVAGLDDVTTYYLLHRHDFGMNDAPAGACILYALSCNLSEGDLADRYAVILRSGGVDLDDDGEPDEGDADAEGDVTEGSGSTFKLRPWKQRRRAGLGTATVNGSSAVPLVDMAHHLMHLWVDGDVHKVNAYIDERGLRRSETFRHVLQALIELADEGSEERSVLERISKHLEARGHAPASLRDVGLGVPAVDQQE